MPSDALPNTARRVTPLLDEATLARRIDELADEIIAAVPQEFTLVAVLKGAFVFAADLMRALGRAGRSVRIEFLRVSSYGAAKESSGSVQILGAVPADLAGRTVLLVDDIADSGRSLSVVRQQLIDAGVADVRICALLDKPSRRVVPVPVDFIGFTVEDVFVVGYGIDFAEDYRHLPYVGVVD